MHAPLRCALIDSPSHLELCLFKELVTFAEFDAQWGRQFNRVAFTISKTVNFEKG